MDDRTWIGNPTTVGELQKMLCKFDNKTKLASRNAPLPTLFRLIVEGEEFVEIEVQQQTATTMLQKLAQWLAADCG